MWFNLVIMYLWIWSIAVAVLFFFKNTQSNQSVSDVETSSSVRLLTIDEHNGLLDGMLVAELRIEQRSADKGAIVGGLVPAHMQMVNVDVTQRTHHLHLVLD